MSTTTQERPGRVPEAAHKSFSGDTHSLRDNGPVCLAPAVVDELTRPAVRSVQEAITYAQPCTWTRRAEQLENARPRPGEFHGQATREDLAERYARLTEQAAACREHAELLRRYPTPIGEDLAALVVAFIGGDPR
ncbi:hypothetical protein [Tessaracoccus sp. Z1128]